MLRLASVSFINSKPLNWGLAQQSDLSLELVVPSGLANKLASREADVALLPVVDLQRVSKLAIIPSAGIGSNGTTLTVRLFARTPIEDVTVVAADPDSHTSVALSKIVLAELLGKTPPYIDLRDATDAPGEVRLLIGDKVICEEPSGFPYQLDLGAAWLQLTGLPFVFAIWAAHADTDLGDLPTRLRLAKETGLQHVDEIVRTMAVPRGWPADIARQYLTSYLKFDIDTPQLAAIELFHQKAFEHGILDHAPWQLPIRREANTVCNEPRP